MIFRGPVLRFSELSNDWKSFLESIWMFPKIVGFPPKSSVLIRFSIINHPFWGTPIFGNTHHMNKAIPKSPRHKDLKNLDSCRPRSAPFSGILPSQCCMLWVHETISIFINPKLRKGQKSKILRFHPKPPTYHPTPNPPKKIPTMQTHTSVLSLESRSSQPFPNRLSVLGGSSQLVSG